MSKHIKKEGPIRSKFIYRSIRQALLDAAIILSVIFIISTTLASIGTLAFAILGIVLVLASVVLTVSDADMMRAASLPIPVQALLIAGIVIASAGLLWWRFGSITLFTGMLIVAALATGVLVTLSIWKGQDVYDTTLPSRTRLASFGIGLVIAATLLVLDEPSLVGGYLLLFGGMPWASAIGIRSKDVITHMMLGVAICIAFLSLVIIYLTFMGVVPDRPLVFGLLAGLYITGSAAQLLKTRLSTVNDVPSEVNMVTMIGTLPPIRGLSYYTRELCNALQEHVEIDFIGFDNLYPEFAYPGGKTTIPDAEVAERSDIDQRIRLNWYDPFGWIRAGLTAKGDVLHAQWWSWVLAPIYLTILGIAKLRKKHIVITIHNITPHEMNRLNVFLNKSVLGLGDTFIVHSERNEHRLRDMLDVGERRVDVIPHGPISVEEIDVDHTTLRESYGLDAADQVVLFFGNIRPYKGLDILLRTMPHLEDPTIKLIIAGQAWEDFSTYHQVIDELQLGDRIQLLLGFQPDAVVNELVRISDVMVAPYRYFNSSSGVASISLSAKKPIVVTEVGALPDFVSDPQVIAQPDDTLSLAHSIEYALANLDKLAEDSAIVAARFGWESIAQKTVGTYRNE